MAEKDNAGKQRIRSGKMKKGLTFVLLVVLPILSSCSRVEYEVYKHEPTEHIRRSLWNSHYKKADALKGENLVFIPYFIEFAPSYSRHSSRLMLCSNTKEPVWISKAILRVEGEDTQTVLDISKEFSFDKPIGKTGYHRTGVLLFNDENTDYSKYKSKKNLELEIQFSSSQSKEMKTKVFKLKLIKRKDIAWVT